MKRLKDPIYGYIDIEDNVFEEIIDTATFQRLRFIVQTSYSPLYASAVHNRFVHSLGVYYLGNLVSKSFTDSAREIGFTLEIDYMKIFSYACLLHDVGHAPFSHTGEDFYLGSDSSRDSLHRDIVSLTGDNSLDSEIKLKNYGAAPHELMSVVVALKMFPELFKNNLERSFFARCILGYNYVKELTQEKSFLNCIISLLNSSVIDVDKLDYLIRDAYITGFDTVSLDYVRLLRSAKIVASGENCLLVFSKGAISVIENVVFAHDAEKKWIQNHPIIQYDSYLLKHAIEILNSKYDIFSYEALTLEGKELTNGFKISLLADADMLFLMKNNLTDPLIEEYFSRKNRRHPLWKSEAEYKAVFNIVFSEATFNTVEDEFENLAKYLNFTIKSSEINPSALCALREDIRKTEALIQSPNVELGKISNLKKQLAIKNKHLEWVLCLENFATDQIIDFDFLIIKASQFNSGFSKLEFENILIEFPISKTPSKFKKVSNTLSASKSEREKFYYLFYRRVDKSKRIEVSKLATALSELAVKEAYTSC